MGAESTSPAEIRLHRILLASGGAAYLVWWLFVELTLPGAFNPIPGRLGVVACFLLVLAASYAWKQIADRLPDALAMCCVLLTAHYFYLLERNHADLNWIIGSYITITAICAILQTARSLLLYSLAVAILAVGLLTREAELSFVVFMPGTMTILLFANIGLRGRLVLLAKLQESNLRIESLFDSGFEGIAVVEGRIIREANGALSRLVGLARDRLVGRSIDEILAGPADAPTVSPGETPCEAELVRKDSTRIAVEVVGKRHVIGGKAMRLFAIRDLTARKQAQAELMAANRELEAFSYSVAHDLRAPLRGIDGFSRILVDEFSDSLDDTGKGYLAKVRAAAQRMGQLIDDLLALAKVGRAEVARQQLDVSKLAAEVAAELRGRDPSREVTFTIQPGIVVEADARLLHILLENLIGNAWKFTSKTPGATIDVGAETRAEGFVLCVGDNGAGFDMAFASKLFGPFQRLHRRDEFPGTGIGLATVQRIVHRHGGRVWAEAALNQGATFQFTLAPPGWRSESAAADLKAAG